MSSLRDIMDVDVEPLESQAMRSRQAAQQHSDLDQSRSPISHAQRHDARDLQQVSRRRSHRVSKSTSQGTSSKPILSRRQSSVTAESMEQDSYPQGGSQMANAAGVGRQTPRSSNPPESVRYTPVTGRVSRAKKGQPVHVCEQCDPPRVFTRAEHLRRHQLGHQKPAYPCTFEDCEKAFHRPDLLARHINRHETQGEKAYKAGDDDSRSSSSSCDSRSARFKVQTPLMGDTSNPSQTPGTTSFTTPQTLPNTQGTMTGAIYESMGNFPAANFSNHTHKQRINRFDRDSLRPSSTGSTVSSSMLPSNMGPLLTSFPTPPMHNLSQGANFVNMTPPSLRQMYPNQSQTDQIFQDSNSPNSLPLLTLQVPEPPGLSYANSPWCSSESTWSTPSDRYGNTWTRDRSASAATSAEGNSQPLAWSPQYGSLPLQTPRTVGLDALPETYESPPYVSPHLSPLNSSYPLAGVSSPAGGYQELVGIPTPSGPFKMLAQSSSALTNRISSSELGRSVSRTNILVDIPGLNSPSGEVGTVNLSARMEEYMIAYWAHLEPVYSFIHPETFDVHSTELLRNAMAALGSQFHTMPGDRENGSQLHESCTRMIVPHMPWNFQNMQAIFLTEIFGRFRSQKIDVRPSSAFRKLYKILVDASASDSKSKFARLDFNEIDASVELETQITSKDGPLVTRQQVIDRIWREWIEYEVRQRIRGACFLFDSHQRFCYEQRRVQPEVTGENTFIVVPCPKPLWTATTSQQWYQQIQKMDCSAVRLIHPETMTAEQVSRLPLSAQAHAGSLVIELLPARDEFPHSNMNPSANAQLVDTLTTLFPQFIHTHGYLALYYTPLHHLLSLTGNTWLFGQKLTSHSDIDAIAPAIRNWSSSPAAAHATWHACHLLKRFFEAPTINRPYRGVSEYWFLYTATLIIWAFGHRTPMLSVSGLSSTNISRRTSSVTLAADDPTHGRAAAQIWLDAMLELKPEDLFNSPLRTDTAAVMDAARWTLEEDSAMSQGRSGMLLDACGVLDRIREGGRLF